MPHTRLSFLVLITSLSFACGGDGFDRAHDEDFDPAPGANNQNNSPNNASWDENNQNSFDMSPPFEPEEEEFLVRQVASTERWVFVPNSTEESEMVALIDGRDLTVYPIRVGRQPVQVVANDVDGEGAVAFVLCAGSSSIAIIRADRPGQSRPVGHTNLLRIPSEVNRLVASPDGRHVLAYIDPDQPLAEGVSVASLQVAALIVLGADPSEDRVHRLSITRAIRDIKFTDDGLEAFVLGAEGLNHLVFNDISEDTFIAPMNLPVFQGLFPPEDAEFEVDPMGRFVALRTSEMAAVAVFEVPARPSDEIRGRVLPLSGIPTDLDLLPNDSMGEVWLTLRNRAELVIADVEAILSAEGEDPDVDVISLEGTGAGLAQRTPDGRHVLLYTTLDTRPFVSVMDVETRELRSYQLRNTIRSLAIAPNSSTAIVLHRRQTEKPEEEFDAFQLSEGVTLFDLATGYRRPVVLSAEPTDTLMTRTQGEDAVVYVRLRSPVETLQGLMRMNLTTFRSDFVPLPRTPLEMGVVAGRVFVSQEAEEGRITFFDVDTNAQQSISGFELNAGID